MSGTRKFVVWSLAIALLLTVAAGVAIKVYVTKERVLAWVIPPLEEKLGRKVTIGDVAIGFTSFDLIDFSVSGTQSDKPLASVGRVRVAWRLMPLLRARLEVAEATVESPRFHIVRLADATLAIDDLLTKGEAKKSGKLAQETSPARETQSGAEVVVEVVSIVDGAMTFEDRMESPTKSYVVDDFDAEVTGLSSGSEAFFELTARLGPLGGAPLELKGSVTPETSELAANLKIGSFELTALNPYMGEGLSFASGSALVNVKLAAKGGEPGPVELDVGVKGMTLALPQSTTKVGKSADLSLAAKFALEPESVELKHLRLDIDGQVIEADGRVELTEPPVVTLSARAKALFVDRLTALLPDGGQDGGKNSGKDTTASKDSTDEPPAKVGVEADIDLSVGHLEASGLAFDEVALKLTLKDGVLKITPLGADFYEGKINLNATVELERVGPPLVADASVNGVRIEQLLPALSPALKDTITGELDANLDAASSGSSGTGVKGVVATLGGAVKDGKISSTPLTDKLAALFNSDGLREINFYTLLWDVKVRKGVATVERLYLDGRELALRGNGTVGLEDQRLDMSVVVSVPAELARKLLHDKNIIEALTDEQGRVGVPLRLTGVATEPKYSLDERKLSKIAGKAAKKAISNKVKKLLEEKGGKLGPLEKVLPGLLDKLFGN
jgi:AsmA protein